MSTVRDWLTSLDLSEYGDRFEENRIDFEILPDLTDQDLEKLGVVLGDRRTFLARRPAQLTSRAYTGARDLMKPPNAGNYR